MQRLITPQRIQSATHSWLPLIGKKVVVRRGSGGYRIGRFHRPARSRGGGDRQLRFLAPEIGNKRRQEHIERMRDIGITMHTQCNVTKITTEGVWFKPLFGDKEHMLKADTVLLAGSSNPRPSCTCLQGFRGRGIHRWRRVGAWPDRQVHERGQCGGYGLG